MESWTVVVVLLVGVSGVIGTPLINELQPGKEWPSKNSVRQPSESDEITTILNEPALAGITLPETIPRESVNEKEPALEETSSEDNEKEKESSLAETSSEDIEKEKEPVLVGKSSEDIEKEKEPALVETSSEDSEKEKEPSLAETSSEDIEKEKEPALVETSSEDSENEKEPSLAETSSEDIEKEKELALLGKSSEDIEKERDPALAVVPLAESSTKQVVEEKEPVLLTNDPVESNAEDSGIEEPDAIILKIGNITEDVAKVDYSGAQVWKISTNRTGVRAVLTRLRRRNLISTWGGDHTSADILVKHDAINNVTRIFKRENIAYDVIIEDLQKRINEENPPLSPEEAELHDRSGHRMTWKQYHRVEDIYGYMDYLAKTYPSIVSVKKIGKSHENRDIKVLRISDGKPTNKAIFIDGGIHAREWISPATVTYFINQFAENFDVESDDVKNTDWYFLPVVNPDGYEFTHLVDRLWRKNRKPGSNTARVCYGTDLNRNFGYRWGGKGASTNPCSETYRGRSAFSEPESKALSDFITNSGTKFSAYLTYHSYGQYLLYPWGYDNVVPPDYKEMDAVGKQVAEAILQTGGSKYSVGSSSGLLYPASGGSDDWAKAQGIKYSYTIELSDTGRYGFILPTSYIIPVAKENLAGLRVLTKQIHQE